jgi:hypothetical protein
MTVDVEVELYRSEDYVRGRRQPLLPLLREVFEPLLGPISNARIVLTLLGVEDTQPLGGSPEMVNLRGSHGYAQVSVYDESGLVYRHPHTLREMVGRPLQRQLRVQHPDVDHWGYSLVGPGLEGVALIRPVPYVHEQTDIGGRIRRRPVPQVEEIPPPEPPPSSLAELHVPAGQSPEREPAGVDDPDREPFAAVLTPAAHEDLARHEFSAEVEEGGFLIGHVHRDTEVPGRRLLEVTSVVTAERTGASLLQFTFTGESFLRLADLMARRGRDERILGWFHTHLFSATPRFGLSSVDVELHTSTFRQPGQLAALVNLGAAGRLLRIYRSVESGDGGDGGDGAGGVRSATGKRAALVEAPYWVAKP